MSIKVWELREALAKFDDQGEGCQRGPRRPVPGGGAMSRVILKQRPPLEVVRYVLERLERRAVEAGGFPTEIHLALENLDKAEQEAARLRAALEKTIPVLEFACDCYEGPTSPEEEEDRAILAQARAALSPEPEGKKCERCGVKLHPSCNFLCVACQ